MHTKQKGDIGEINIIKDLTMKGYSVSIPFGENNNYDLILDKNNKLYKIQVKYTESNNKVIKVKCRSTNNWLTKKYNENMIDFIAIYDKTTDDCFYIHNDYFKEGRSLINLRLKPCKNNQTKGIHFAENFKKI